MVTATPIPITDTNHADWLLKRQQSVGASECAAALGASPWETPVGLWQLKTGRRNSGPENEAMRWGKLLEPLVAAEYRRLTGMAIREQLYCVHPRYPFMTATLDGLREDGRLVELKTASGFSRDWGDEESEEVPLPYLLQVHHQMAVTGASAADLAVLIGGQRFKVYPITRDEELIERIENRVARFWRSVERDTPPDWGRLTTDDLAQLYPGCAGEIEASEELADLILEYEDNAGLSNVHAEKADALKLQILGLMGTAQFARLPDGRRLKRFVEAQGEKEITYTRKAYTKVYFKILKGQS